MTTFIQWKTLRVTTPKKSKFGTPVKEHPLKNVMVIEKTCGSSTEEACEVKKSSISKTLKMTVLDPLSEFALEVDPLSRTVTETVSLYISDSKSSHHDEESHINKMEPWSTRKVGILSKYTTSEKLCIITSFLPDGDKVLMKAQSSSVDKVQHRLDQLDTFEEGTQKKLNLSQAEYIGRIEQLNKELVLAWNTEQRVKALKIAIQCAKLLVDTDVLQFYPSKFVLVTDILETFGKIVYERLKLKAELSKLGSKTKTSLPNDFSPDMVPESAKETCLNWFYKIASIRELVPRLYVEMALIKSYNFISKDDCPESLLRISDMIIGIGNPLVALYARCYLCIVGINALNNKSDYKFLQTCLKGFINSYQLVFSRSVISETHAQKMNMTSYLILYIPGLNFMIEAVACYSDEVCLSDLIGICKRHKNSSLLVNTLISVFKPSKVSEKILEILDLIEHCADYQAIPLSMLLKALGVCVNTCPPPAEHRTLLLATVSRHLSSITDPMEFITCLDAWVIYFVTYLTTPDLNNLLGDIIERLVPNKKFEDLYNELKIIINKIVTNTQDFETLLILDNFLLIIDLFHDESTKVEVCKNILVLSNNEQKTNDPVVINTLMYLCSILHDSVDALIPEDEYRQIGEIICGILRRIYFGRDFEQQLNFFVMARGAFCNVDLVLAELVQQVNTLSVNARLAVKGLHTKKSGDFVRACAAYCFITIPSVISEKTRLQLYLLSGQVAIFNQCFGQAEASFTAAWSILVNLKDLFNQKDSFLVSYIKQTVSALLVLPDNPERGVLSVLRMLLNSLKSLELEDHILALLYINVINMLSVMAQDEFLYQIDKVESNDALYGADPKFIAEIDKICSVLLGEIKVSLAKHPGSKSQYNIAVELFTTVTTRGDLSQIEMQTLAIDLWGIILKNSHLDRTFIANTRLYLENSYKLRNVLFEDFIKQLRLP